MLSKKKQNDLLIKYLDLESMGFIEDFRNRPDFGCQFVKVLDDTKIFLAFRIFKNRFFWLHGWLYNSRIESIITSMMTKNNLTRPPQDVTFSFPYPKNDLGDFLSEKIHEAQAIELISDDDVNKVALVVTNMIEGYYGPMFERFSNLKTIDEEIIQKVSHDELINYISQPMPFKKMIIMKICNNPDYENYRDWFQDVLKKSTNEEEEKKYYKLFIDLRDYLEREF